MAIYRGNGGASDITSGITLNEVTALTLRAEDASDAAAASATEAAASEAGVAADAIAAASSATNAASSATDSASSATDSASSAAAAAASYDSFDDRYLGTKASNPSLDNDGNALIIGALYFNTTVPEMRVYTSGGWIQVAPTTTTITEILYVDGGFSNSVYTISQTINGGTA